MIFPVTYLLKVDADKNDPRILPSGEVLCAGLCTLLVKQPANPLEVRETGIKKRPNFLEGE